MIYCILVLQVIICSITSVPALARICGENQDIFFLLDYSQTFNIDTLREVVGSLQYIAESFRRPEVRDTVRDALVLYPITGTFGNNAGAHFIYDTSTNQECENTVNEMTRIVLRSSLDIGRSTTTSSYEALRFLSDSNVIRAGRRTSIIAIQNGFSNAANSHDLIQAQINRLKTPNVKFYAAGIRVETNTQEEVAAELEVLGEGNPNQMFYVLSNEFTNAFINLLDNSGILCPSEAESIQTKLAERPFGPGTPTRLELYSNCLNSDLNDCAAERLGVTCESVELSPATAQVDEGDDITLTATLSIPLDRPVTVQLQTRDGTANAPGDYMTENRILTFPVGETSQIITISTTEDDISEMTENFEAFLSAPTNGLFLGAQTSSTIEVNDDDESCLLTDLTYAVAEGNGTFIDVVALHFNVITVQDCVLTMESDSAVAGFDYESLSTVVSDSQQILRISIIDDEYAEEIEKFRVQLSSRNPDVKIVGQDFATVVIADTDEVRFRFGALLYSVNEDEGSVDLTIIKDGAINCSVELKFETCNHFMCKGSATEDDYTAMSQVVTIPADETNVTVSVSITNDQIHEDDETFMVMITEIVDNFFVIITEPLTTVQIMNDDRIELNFNSNFYTANEGDGQIVLTVTKQGVASVNTVTTFQIVNGSASSTADFLSCCEKITFEPDQIQKNITILITNDDIPEDSENFTVMIEGASVLLSRTATLNIKDDENMMADETTSATTIYWSVIVLLFVAAIIITGILIGVCWKIKKAKASASENNFVQEMLEVPTELNKAYSVALSTRPRESFDNVGYEVIDGKEHNSIANPGEDKGRIRGKSPSHGVYEVIDEDITDGDGRIEKEDMNGNADAEESRQSDGYVSMTGEVATVEIHSSKSAEDVTDEYSTQELETISETYENMAIKAVQNKANACTSATSKGSCEKITKEKLTYANVVKLEDEATPSRELPEYENIYNPKQTTVAACMKTTKTDVIVESTEEAEAINDVSNNCDDENSNKEFVVANATQQGTINDVSDNYDDKNSDKNFVAANATQQGEIWLNDEDNVDAEVDTIFLAGSAAKEVSGVIAVTCETLCKGEPKTINLEVPDIDAPFPDDIAVESCEAVFTDMESPGDVTIVSDAATVDTSVTGSFDEKSQANASHKAPVDAVVGESHF